MTEEQYRNVLNNIAGSFGTLRDQVNQAFEIGRALGLNDMQIGSDVRSRIKGLMSTSTIQRMLPETAKHQEKKRAAAVKLTAKQRYIPPPPKVLSHDEVIQIVRERQNVEPKAIDEPITIPTGDKQIMLDTGKFRSDLRIALINGAKVWLSYNNAKEVIKINEKENPQV